MDRISLFNTFQNIGSNTTPEVVAQPQISDINLNVLEKKYLNQEAYHVEIRIVETSPLVHKQLQFKEEEQSKLNSEGSDPTIHNFTDLEPTWNTIATVTFRKEEGKKAQNPNVQYNFGFLNHENHITALDKRVENYRAEILETDLIKDLASKKFEELKATWPEKKH